MWPVVSKKVWKAPRREKPSCHEPRVKLAIASYIALGVVWGTAFMFMQLAEPYITAGQTTLVRLVFGIIPVLIFGLVTKAIRLEHLRYLHHFLVQGVLAAGLYYYAYAAGTYRLESSVAGVLSGSIPIFASVAALVVFRTERFTARKLTGVLVGAVGVIMLAQPWSATEIDVAGVLWMLLGSASLGLSFGYARRFITPLGIPAAATATYQMVVAAAGLAIFIDLDGITAIAEHPGVLLSIGLGLGVLGTGFAFVFYYVAVNGLGALTASTATYIAPVVALLIGVGLLSEPLTPITIFATVLILSAAVILQLPDRKPAELSTV